MYGHATAQEQATGLGRRWKYNEQSKTLDMDNFYECARAELECMAWYMIHKGMPNLKCRWNTGQVININGKFPDAYDPDTNTCIFFDGCRWHAHLCHLTENLAERIADEKEFVKRADRDYHIRKFLRDRGYKVIVITECEWEQLKENPEVQVVIDFD